MAGQDMGGRRGQASSVPLSAWDVIGPAREAQWRLQMIEAQRRAKADPGAGRLDAFEQLFYGPQWQDQPVMLTGWPKDKQGRPVR